MDETSAEGKRGPIVVDLDDAFADAEYQLYLLTALQKRAFRIERISAAVASVASAAAAAATAFSVARIPADLKSTIGGVSVNALAVTLTLIGAIATLVSIILWLRQRARDQRLLLEAEEIRLVTAIQNARKEVADLRIQQNVRQP